MNYTKLHLSEIPIEEAHGGSGARQMLIEPEYLTTPFLEAITKGYLKSGGMFDWHNHQNTDEIFIVTQGTGKFYYREGDNESFFNFQPEDIIIAPANMFHKIVAEGNIEMQGFFFRVKAEPSSHQYNFVPLHLKDIPFEAVHNVPKSRQTLVTEDVVVTNYLEALTKGILRAGNVWDWHSHKDTDEVSIVLRGEGKYFIGDEQVNYIMGNVFVIPANTVHKIKSTKDTEFYFIRVRNK